VCGGGGHNPRMDEISEKLVRTAYEMHVKPEDEGTTTSRFEHDERSVGIQTLEEAFNKLDMSSLKIQHQDTVMFKECMQIIYVENGIILAFNETERKLYSGLVDPFKGDIIWTRLAISDAAMLNDIVPTRYPLVSIVQSKIAIVGLCNGNAGLVRMWDAKTGELIFVSRLTNSYVNPDGGTQITHVKPNSIQIVAPGFGYSSYRLVFTCEPYMDIYNPKGGSHTIVIVKPVGDDIDDRFTSNILRVKSPCVDSKGTIWFTSEIGPVVLYTALNPSQWALVSLVPYYISELGGYDHEDITNMQLCASFYIGCCQKGEVDKLDTIAANCRAVPRTKPLDNPPIDIAVYGNYLGVLYKDCVVVADITANVKSGFDMSMFGGISIATVPAGFVILCEEYNLVILEPKKGGSVMSGSFSAHESLIERESDIVDVVSEIEYESDSLLFLGNGGISIDSTTGHIYAHNGLNYIDVLEVID
jgi:hypothetical protein